MNNHGHLLVTVDNDLVSLPWSHGSVLVLNLDHVLETANEANLMQLTNILNSLGSVKYLRQHARGGNGELQTGKVAATTCQTHCF